MIPWTVTVLLCAVLFLVKAAKQIKQDGQYPPTVRSIPFIGGLLWMFTKNMAKNFIDIGKEYGPIARTYMGWKELIVLNSPDSIKEAGKVPAFSGQADLLITRIMKGKGLFWADDAKEQRKFVLKNLKHLDISKELESNIQDEVTGFLERLKSHEPTLPPNDPEAKHLLERLEILAELRNPIMRLCFYFPSLADWFPSSLSGKSFIENLVSDVYKMVERYSEINRKTRTDQFPRNFADAIMDKVDEISDESSVFHSSQEAWIRIVMDMILGAVDTTSSTLEWAMCFLSQHPQVITHGLHNKKRFFHPRKFLRNPHGSGPMGKSRTV
ncbi:unnamed protein product [Allacma fusca]|uniref:Cytochrome P450 n=1 Tax=Allacma fusca TaxID=39272 RepID=A0A8J2KFN1_9HEXA|nr:unnamed protein product [Allacma fusca]